MALIYKDVETVITGRLPHFPAAIFLFVSQKGGTL
jgi:hypothetical protein